MMYKVHNPSVVYFFLSMIALVVFVLWLGYKEDKRGRRG